MVVHDVRPWNAIKWYTVSHTTFPDKPLSKNKAKLFDQSFTSPLNPSDQIFQDEIGPGRALYWTLQLLQHELENLRRTFCLGLLLWSIGLWMRFLPAAPVVKSLAGNQKMWMTTTGGEVNDQTPPSRFLALCPHAKRNEEKTTRVWTTASEGHTWGANTQLHNFEIVVPSKNSGSVWARCIQQSISIVPRNNRMFHYYPSIPLHSH